MVTAPMTVEFKFSIGLEIKIVDSDLTGKIQTACIHEDGDKEYFVKTSKGEHWYMEEKIEMIQ